MVELVIESGTARGKAQIMSRIQRAVDRSVKLGVAQTIGELLPRVAYKRGRLTTGVQKMLQRQVTEQKGKRRQTIGFRKELVVAKDKRGHNYAPYHMYPGGNYGRNYYHPSSAGTGPIKVAEWNRTLHQKTVKQVPNQLIKQGLVVVSKESV